MVVNLKSETELSAFYIVFNGSTLLENIGARGIYHLLEHLKCKAFEHLYDEFEKDCIEWNAYTSSNEINFYIRGIEEKVIKYREEFLKCLLEFKITKEEFENERKIVMEEYYDSFNSQMENHMLNLNRKLFNDYDPIGSGNDLKKLTFKDIVDYHDLQFSAPSKIINITKNSPFISNIELNNVISNKELSYLSDNKFEYEKGNTYKDKTSIIILSPIINENFAYVSFMTEMLAGGFNSPLFQEVREKKGLVYSINCYQTRFNKQGIVTICTQTSNENTQEVKDIIKMVLSNKEKYLTEERFNIIKENLVTRYKMNNINRYRHIDKYLSPEGWSVSDILNTVTFNDIYTMYDKYFNVDEYYFSDDKTEFVNLEK